MESDEYHDMVRRLTAMMAQQHGFNERLTLAIERIDQTLAQQAEINTDVKTTLARIETLLARMIQSSGNGQDA